MDHPRLEIFKQAARPFTIYAGTLTVCAGVLMSIHMRFGDPAALLTIVGTVVLGHAAMRSIDKFTLKGTAAPDAPAG